MLKVLKAGFYTTIQDGGRFGWRHKGVPASGTMDDLAFYRVNSLLENSTEGAVLEITMTGPTLQFEEQTYICLGGADLSATLNNEPIDNYHVYKVKGGDILSYGRLQSGFRGYLGVKGGIKVPKVLESSSYYFPLTEYKCLKDFDELNYEPIADYSPKLTDLKVEDYLNIKDLKVSLAPEFDFLDENQKNQIFNSTFSISKENNRMAYQLKENIDGHKLSMLTSATLPGTVQLTPAGKLIILMKDGQTTGGYPRVLQLTKAAIAILAQKKAGDTIKFVAN